MGAKVTRPRLTGRVSVNGDDYDWAVFRDPLYSSVDGWLGLTLSVRQVDHERELLLQFVNAGATLGNAPFNLRPRVSPASVEEGVRAALEAGWNPTARGKAFKFDMGA